MSLEASLDQLTHEMKENLFLQGTDELRSQESDFQPLDTTGVFQPSSTDAYLFWHPKIQGGTSWPRRPRPGTRCMHCNTARFTGPPVPAVRRYDEKKKLFWTYHVFCRLACVLRYLQEQEPQMSTKRLLAFQQMCLLVFGVDFVTPAPHQLRLPDFLGDLTPELLLRTLRRASPSEVLMDPFIQSDMAVSAQVPPKKLPEFRGPGTNTSPHPWLTNAALLTRKVQHVSMQGIDYELLPNTAVQVSVENFQTFVRDQLKKDKHYTQHPFWNGEAILDWHALSLPGLHCFHCHHTFPGFCPLPIPVAFNETHRYWTFLGFSCSFNCGKRFLIDHYPRLAPFLLVFFGLMCREIFGVDQSIQPAKPISQLRAFLGDQDINTYRQGFSMLTRMPFPRLPFLRAEVLIEEPRGGARGGKREGTAEQRPQEPLIPTNQGTPKASRPSKIPESPAEPFGPSFYDKVLRENPELQEVLGKQPGGSE